MLLPSVSVFPAMINGGRPEGGSVHEKEQHTEREEEKDYSKLLPDTVIVAELKLSTAHERSTTHIHTQRTLNGSCQSAMHD